MLLLYLYEPKGTTIETRSHLPVQRRILFVVPQGAGPISMPFVQRLRQAMRESGWSVEEFRVKKTIHPVRLWQTFWALRRQIRHGSYALVNAQFGTFTGLLSAVACGNKVPYVVTFRGSDLNPTPSERKIIWLLQHLLSQSAGFLADGVICVSRGLAERLWASKKPLLIAPSPIDLENFQPRNWDVSRETLGWDKETRVALFVVGSNARVKRLDLALALQKKLAESSSRLQLRILHDPVSAERLSVYFNAADSLLFLSDFEGSPNLVKEAAACNLPIVSFEVGDVPQLLRECPHSALVPRNEAAVLSALEKCTVLRGRSRLRTRVLEYAPDKTATRISLFFESLLCAP